MKKVFIFFLHYLSVYFYLPTQTYQKIQFIFHLIIMVYYYCFKYFELKQINQSLYQLSLFYLSLTIKTDFKIIFFSIQGNRGLLQGLPYPDSIFIKVYFEENQEHLKIPGITAIIWFVELFFRCFVFIVQGFLDFGLFNLCLLWLESFFQCRLGIVSNF